jgi:hypothetical protein
MNEKRIAMLMSEKNSASVAEKLKKALIRKTQLQQERLRDEVLAMHSSTYPPPLRHENKISTLRKKLQPLLALEESSRGRFLTTLEETRALSTKEELLMEINDLEEGSRGWFEDDDAFQERLEKSRSRAQQTKGKSMMRASASNKEGSSIVNKWILPGEKPKSQWGATSGKSKVKGKGGAVFTAMMLDSSSDEEEEVDHPDGKERDDQPLEKKEHIALSNILVSKLESSERTIDKLVPQAEKKRKKKKKSKAKAADHEPATVEEMVVTTAVNTEDSGVPLSVSSSLLEFWKTLLLPVCMAIITLLLSPVKSMFSGRGKGDTTTKKKRR